MGDNEVSININNKKDIQENNSNSYYYEIYSPRGWTFGCNAEHLDNLYERIRNNLKSFNLKMYGLEILLKSELMEELHIPTEISKQDDLKYIKDKLSKDFIQAKIKLSTDLSNKS